MDGNRNRERAIWICAALAVVTLGVYWQITDHSFLDYDDQVYITENKHVKSGLSMESLAWAFKNTLAGNWHPVTVLSHMLDCQLWARQRLAL